MDQSSWAAQSAQTGGNIMAPIANNVGSGRSIGQSNQQTVATPFTPLEIQNRFDVPGFSSDVVN